MCSRSTPSKDIPLMNPRIRCSFILGSVAAGIFFSSCAVVAPTMKPEALTISTEALKNGHLIQIRAGHPVGPVTALLSQGRWVIVTIADTLLDLEKSRLFRSRLVDSVDVARFSIACQIAFRLTVDVDAVEVIHADPGSDILLSLFTKRKQP